MDSSTLPQQRVRELIAESIARLPGDLQAWARNHLTPPRVVEVALNADGSQRKDVWLITDHTGDADSSLRVVYDADLKKFGHECTLASGISWYIGAIGTFAEAVEGM